MATAKEGLEMARLYRVVLSEGYHNADDITGIAPATKSVAEKGGFNV